MATNTHTHIYIYIYIHRIRGKAIIGMVLRAITSCMCLRWGSKLIPKKHFQCLHLVEWCHSLQVYWFVVTDSVRVLPFLFEVKVCCSQFQLLTNEGRVLTLGYKRVALCINTSTSMSLYRDPVLKASFADFVAVESKGLYSIFFVKSNRIGLRL